MEVKVEGVVAPVLDDPLQLVYLLFHYEPSNLGLDFELSVCLGLPDSQGPLEVFVEVLE